MAVITRDGRNMPTMAFSVPRVWWLSPVVISLFIAVASIVPTALLDDQQFRSLWRTPKSITGETLLLFGCGAAALAFGALVAIATAPVTRPPATPWPSLNEQSVRLLRRASTALTAVTLVGYAGFVVLILRAGLNPLRLFSESASYGIRDVVGTIPGVTTLTQFGIAAVVTSTVLLLGEHSRGELYKLLIVTGLALLRAYVFAERLAILELILPIAVILAAHLSVQHGLRRHLAQLIPFGGFLAVVLIFAAFEYFRSWTFYRTTATTSYADFAFNRFVGYYSTALNNGQLALDHLRWPKRLPFDTIEAFWKLPGIESIELYEKLGGHPPPWTDANPSGSVFAGVLNQFGNPEFNGGSGYVGAFVDYGNIGGILYFLLIGLIAGILYRGFCQAKPLGIFLYPVAFVGLLELPRQLYWAQGRAIYALVVLLIIASLVSRSEAKEIHEV